MKKVVNLKQNQLCDTHSKLYFSKLQKIHDILLLITVKFLSLTNYCIIGVSSIKKKILLSVIKRNKTEISLTSEIQLQYVLYFIQYF